MGVCGSRGQLNLEEQARVNRLIEDQMSEDMQESEQVVKLLLLGSGESGKSTIFKQLTLVYGEGFSDVDRSAYKEIIFQNVIANMKVLCQELDNAEWGNTVPEAIAADKLYLEDLRADSSITPEVAAHIRALWRAPATLKTYSFRARYQLTDNCKFFADKVLEIGSPGWVPTDEDVIRARARTTGIVNAQYEIEGTVFELYDVGGQRNERRKWIHCFDNVTAVLFVSAISEYDQVLYEDGKTNRLLEALDLFDQIANHRFFSDTAMILFLNKSDLFRDKITNVPLTVCFPDCTAPQEYDPASVFVREQFLSRNRTASRYVYVHITCATNTDNVRAVFNAVKDIILTASLKTLGTAALMD